MNDVEKQENPNHTTTGGYLKVNSSTYNGKEVSNEDRKFLESLPNFCPKILEECTGIVFDQTKVLTIDGKDIKISKESFDELKRQLLEE
jgi:mannose-1-phosphate guanylyltransferase